MLSMTWSLEVLPQLESRDKRTNRVVPHRQEETRWSDTRPLAERQVTVLGRNCHLPLG